MAEGRPAPMSSGSECCDKFHSGPRGSLDDIVVAPSCPVKYCDKLRETEKVLKEARKSFRCAAYDLDQATDDANCSLHQNEFDPETLLKDIEDTKKKLSELKEKILEHIEQHHQRCRDENEEKWDYFKRNTTSGRVMKRGGSDKKKEHPGSGDSGYDTALGTSPANPDPLGFGDLHLDPGVPMSITSGTSLTEMADRVLNPPEQQPTQQQEQQQQQQQERQQQQQDEQEQQQGEQQQQQFQLTYKYPVQVEEPDPHPFQTGDDDTGRTCKNMAPE